MKVIVTGTGLIVDLSVVITAIETFPFKITEVVSTSGNIISILGEQWAKEQKIPIERFSASWKSFGSKAGLIRNSEMVQYSDGLIAIWDGKSVGTQDIIRKMSRADKTVHLIEAKASHGKALRKSRE